MSLLVVLAVMPLLLWRSHNPCDWYRQELESFRVRMGDEPAMAASHARDDAQASSVMKCFRGALMYARYSHLTKEEIEAAVQRAREQSGETGQN